MNSKQKYILAACLVITVTSESAYSGDQVGSMGSTGAGNYNSNTNSNSYSNTPTVYTAPQSQETIQTTQDGAKKSSGAQQIAEGLQYVVGGVQIVAGIVMIKAPDATGTTKAMGAMMIANGALQISQGAANGDASDYNGNSACALSNTCSGGGGNGLTLPSQGPQIKDFEAKINDSPVIDAATKTQIKTAARGVFDNTGKFNPNATKFKGPDGNTYDASKMNSAADLQGAGFSAAQAKQIMDAAEAAKDKVMSKAAKLGLDTNGINGLDEGNGGAGVAANKADSSEGGAGRGFGGFGGLGGKDGKRDPAALVAGMTKNFNGEPIGVAGDSIFLMMNRRYKLKTSQDVFLNESDLLTPH